MGQQQHGATWGRCPLAPAFANKTRAGFAHLCRKSVFHSGACVCSRCGVVRVS